MQMCTLIGDQASDPHLEAEVVEAVQGHLLAAAADADLCGERRVSAALTQSRHTSTTTCVGAPESALGDGAAACSKSSLHEAPSMTRYMYFAALCTGAR